MTQPVRVLLVEDSPLWSEVLGDMIRSAKGLVLIGVAGDGKKAIEDTHDLRPDIVLMDCHLPETSGLEAVERIMADSPTPILCMTSDPTRDLIFQALDRGALEILPKPDQLPLPHEFLEQTRRRLVSLSRVPVVRRGVRKRSGAASSVQPTDPPLVPRRNPIRAVGIVASTGGPVALRDLLCAMEPLSPPMVVVQHMTPGFVEGFARWLDSEVPARVEVAEHGRSLTSNSVLLAPDRVHLQVAATGSVRLVPDRGQPGLRHVPSGDVLLRSLAVGFGGLCVGVVLTGMGKDGCEGLADIQRAGGITLAQDQPTSAVWGMPRQATFSGAASRTGSPKELGLLLSRLARVGGS